MNVPKSNRPADLGLSVTETSSGMSKMGGAVLGQTYTGCATDSSVYRLWSHAAYPLAKLACSLGVDRIKCS